MACGVQFLEDRGSCGEEKEVRGATTLPREKGGGHQLQGDGQGGPSLLSQLCPSRTCGAAPEFPMSEQSKKSNKGATASWLRACAGGKVQESQSKPSPGVGVSFPGTPRQPYLFLVPHFEISRLSRKLGVYSQIALF